MKTFVEKFINEQSLTELDGEYPYYETVDQEEPNEVMIPSQKLTFADTLSMDIEEAISILVKLKLDGANRVYISDHIDHRGYYFYGTKLIEI